MAIANVDITKDLEMVIRKAIENVVDQEITEAIKRIESRRQQVILDAAIGITNQVSFHVMGETITFAIKKI